MLTTAVTTTVQWPLSAHCFCLAIGSTTCLVLDLWYMLIGHLRSFPGSIVRKCLVHFPTNCFSIGGQRQDSYTNPCVLLNQEFISRFDRSERLLYRNEKVVSYWSILWYIVSPCFSAPFHKKKYCQPPLHVPNSSNVRCLNLVEGDAYQPGYQTLVNSSHSRKGLGGLGAPHSGHVIPCVWIQTEVQILRV